MSFASLRLAVCSFACTGSVFAGCIQPEEPAALRNHEPSLGYFDAGVQAGDTEPPPDAPLDVPDAAPAMPPDDASAMIPTEERPDTLSFEVTTQALGGPYAPRNIGAIWVEDAEGNWLKTLSVWAGVRERYLFRFREVAGGNRLDAITSATRPSHGTHHVTWDLRDVSREPVPNGEYRLVLEMTDRNGRGALVEIPFAIAAEPLDMSPPDQPHFFAMRLRLQ